MLRKIFRMNISDIPRELHCASRKVAAAAISEVPFVYADVLFYLLGST